MIQSWELIVGAIVFLAIVAAIIYWVKTVYDKGGDKPFLCNLGLHHRYNYLPKVGGDLGEISIACRRCGYGLRYFVGTWDIPPEEVTEGVSQQAQIEYGRVMGFFPSVVGAYRQMTMAYDIIKKKFTDEELKSITQQLEEMAELQASIDKQQEV